MRTPFSRAAHHPAVIDTIGGLAASTVRRHHPQLVRRAVVLASGLVVLGVLGWVVTNPAERDAGPSLTEASAMAGAPATTGAGIDLADCVSTRGDQSSGTEAVRAFEYAYYVQRSAVEARKFVTPTSSVIAAEALQPLIDAIPAGTTHCVRTIPLGARASGTEEVFALMLVVWRPGEDLKKYAHTVITKKIEDRWYVHIFK